MKMLRVCMAILALGGSGTVLSAEIDAGYKRKLAEVIEGNLDTWVTQYKDFHQNPELGMEEVRTSAILAREMRKLGFTVTEKVGKTGVVALMKNGEGPLVMVRTDMDALPVRESTGLPYASKAKAIYNGGQSHVMHACGHDIHMAAWVGAAQVLVALKDRWHGALMFVAQPAEEGRGGAQAMLDDGIFARFGLPDHAFALHVGAGPYDTVSLVKGDMNSFAGGFNITFNGRGGHGSRPHATIDPIVMVGKFITDVQTVISREKDPQAFGVVSIGMIAGGTAGNVIPDSASVSGTVRWYESEVGEQLLAGIERTARTIVAQAGAPEADIAIRSGNTNVVNDAALYDRTFQAFSRMDGQMRTVAGKRGTASEDYGLFLREFKSSMYFGVGGYDPALFKPDGTPLDVEKVVSNHNPNFAPVPGPTLSTAVTAMTTAVFNVMND
ncbi:amidohydrolase [Pseudoxanthomonas spadix BD-a59]|uniref:Amidohydrolase n=1 Tax=Pseudoxanthomonas spadix (strain BD-a59) TaxID=1045855 RepID=G7UN23_PSEUP|nr:amidohydrolase [Pseudoxanthomonas spadix]AER55334.1 amidohydrolase [Pseudoxanthomonas spadix BD-a59]